MGSRGDSSVNCKLSSKQLELKAVSSEFEAVEGSSSVGDKT
jgi:hypothetical protein